MVNRHVDWERHQIAIPGRHAKDKENRLIVTLRGYDVVKNIKTIKNELRAQPNVGMSS